MNKIIKALVATSLITNVNCVVMANSDPADYSALTGEYVASNPGLEIAVPRWKRVDNDGSGKVDGYNFYFDVFKSGTQIKLFSTPTKYLAFNLECADSAIPDTDIIFKRIGNNIVMSANFRIPSSCAASKTGNSGQVYVVDISTTGKTPWVKSFSGKLIATGILPDTNGNGVGELSVTIQTGTNPITNDNSDNSFYVYDGQTGESLAKPQKYAIVR